MKENPNVTIEKTSKKLKLHTILSTVLFIISFAIMGSSFQFESIIPIYIGGVFLVTSIIWAVVTKIRIYWNHE